MSSKRIKPLFMTIDGDGGDNTLIGTPNPDTLNGFGGNDTLIGEGGADTLIGGTGNDDYRVEEAGDLVVENVGEGFDRVYALVSYALSASAEVELLSMINPSTTGPANQGFTLVGNAFAQTIIGSAAGDVLIAGGGGDVLSGGLGQDQYRIEDTRDVIIETSTETFPGIGFGDKAYVGLSVGSWTLTAGTRLELISAIDNNSTASLNLTGNEFNQAINGTEGDNVLIGGGGIDVLTGYGGNDTYRVENAQTNIVDSGGADRAYATVTYTLSHYNGVNLLSTIDPTATTLIDLGGNGAHNTLIGNAGVNHLTGAGGADDFAFVSALGPNNIDIITDMTSGSDKILLDDAIFTGMAQGRLAAGAFVTGTAAQDADDRIIYDQATGAIFFDADGNGAGAAIQFATLSTKPVIVAADFYVY